ncbi:MAG: OadG family transporter subunit [Subdoligranulum sp.]|jgi:NADH-quinone oxidoreductase subunit I 2 (fragment)
MSNSIALLALEAADGTVVLTSITLVFAMLVALCLIITVEGKIFDAIKNKKNGTKAAPAAPAAPAAQNIAKAAPAAPAAPAADGSIPGEIVAAIAAAVASLGENLTIRGIHRVQKKTATGSRRGAWGDAGVTQNTTPFM